MLGGSCTKKEEDFCCHLLWYVMMYLESNDRVLKKATTTNKVKFMTFLWVKNKGKKGVSSVKMVSNLNALSLNQGVSLDKMVSNLNALSLNLYFTFMLCSF